MNASQLVTDIVSLLDYNWGDEENDYVESYGEFDINRPEDMNQTHIFTAMVRLYNFSK
jgi:hypothetical protein